MDNNEKIVPKYEPGDNFFKKFENFWYYHKWKVIIAVFFVVVFIVCSLQMCSRDEQDITVMYAGPYKFGQTDKLDFASTLSLFATDRNGDGVVKAALVDLYIMSDEQIKAGKAEVESEGGVAVVNYEAFSENYKAFTQHIWSGDTVICLLDPSLYESVYVENEDGEVLSGFMKLEEVLGYLPNGAYDEYSIRVKDLPVGQYYPVLRNLDDDTLLCVRHISAFSDMLNKKKTEEYHKYCLDVFRNLFEFEIPAE